MIKPAKPEREAERLAELHRYRILDTDPEQAYDDLLTIVAGICNTPMGAVTLIDGDRQWLKARQGIDVTETSRDVAFCAHAILEPDKLLQVRDSQADPRFSGNPFAQGAGGVRFYAGAPLVTSTGNAVGTLCVMDTEPRELTKEQSEALTRLARQVVSLMELRKAYSKLQHHLDERDWYETQLKRYHEELEQQNAELTEQSRTDALTGLPNRRAFGAALERAIEGASAGQRLYVAVIDIDHFKNINDTLGHAGGDEVLRQFGARLQETLRRGVDWVARIGGEEFAIVLPETGYGQALDVARKLRATVANTTFDVQGRSIDITASFGLCGLETVPAGVRKISENLVKIADAALYRSKNAGRNRVTATMFPAEQPPGGRNSRGSGV